MKFLCMGDWEGKTPAEAMKDFFDGMYDTEKKGLMEKWIGDQLAGVDWIFLYYSYENYSGDSYAVFRKDGKIYENSGSHCSCYGLEDQWKPSEGSVDSVMHQLTQGKLGVNGGYWGDSTQNVFRDELLEFLKQL